MINLTKGYITQITNTHWRGHYWTGGYNEPVDGNTSEPYPYIVNMALDFGGMWTITPIIIYESVYTQHKEAIDAYVIAHPGRDIRVKSDSILNIIQAQELELSQQIKTAETYTELKEESDYFNSETAVWANQDVYAAELTELNAEIEQLLQGKQASSQTTAPGTTTQPAGTQPDKAAGLNPLIPVALAFAGVAAVVVMAKVKS